VFRLFLLALLFCSGSLTWAEESGPRLEIDRRTDTSISHRHPPDSTIEQRTTPSPTTVIPAGPRILPADQPAADEMVEPQPAATKTQTPPALDSGQPAASARPAATLQPSSGPAMATAWKDLRQGRLQEARRAFTNLRASKHVATANEAALGLAYTLIRQGKKSHALPLLADLARTGYRTRETAPSAFDLALALGRLETGASLLPLLPKDERPSRKLALEVARLKALSATAPAGSTQKEEVLAQLVRLVPTDRAGREQLAWHCLQTGNFSCADEQFAELLREHPDDTSALKGQVLALQARKQPDQAWDQLHHFLARHASSDPDLLLLAGSLAYDRGEYALSVIYLRSAFALQPPARNDRELYIWALLKSGDHRQAEVSARQLHDAERDPASARLLFAVLENSGQTSQVRALEDELAVSADAEMRLLTTERLASQQRFRRAAAIQAPQDACFHNCDQPDAGIGALYRYKQGDQGISRLGHLRIPAEMRSPLADGGMWRGGVTTHILDAGSGPEAPYMGSYYRWIENTANNDRDQLEHTTVWTPFIGFASEGPQHFGLEAGTTPLGGPVDPMPTFTAWVAERGNFRLEAHQTPVDDSMLSFVGQEDPYADRTWGRVLRSGLELEKTVPLPWKYWTSLLIQGDYYWGEEVEDNSAVAGTLSVGRTFGLDRTKEWNAGLFATLKHFQRNSDFYTFGHGGYFSPALFIMAGPFVRLTTPPCRQWFVDAEASMGWMRYRTDDAPKYVGAEALQVTRAEAMEELTGTFAGETTNDIGVTGRLKAWRLMGPHWALGGFGGVNTSAEHSQWHGGLQLRIFFQPRNALCDADCLDWKE